MTAFDKITEIKIGDNRYIVPLLISKGVLPRKRQHSFFIGGIISVFQNLYSLMFPLLCCLKRLRMLVAKELRRSRSRALSMLSGVLME